MRITKKMKKKPYTLTYWWPLTIKTLTIQAQKLMDSGKFLYQSV